MKLSFARTLPAALVLAIASVGLSAIAQTPAPAPAAQPTQPTMVQKAEATGKKAVNATKRVAKYSPFQYSDYETKQGSIA